MGIINAIVPHRNLGLGLRARVRIRSRLGLELELDLHWFLGFCLLSPAGEDEHVGRAGFVAGHVDVVPHLHMCGGVTVTVRVRLRCGTCWLELGSPPPTGTRAGVESGPRWG